MNFFVYNHQSLLRIILNLINLFCVNMNCIFSHTVLKTLQIWGNIKHNLTSRIYKKNINHIWVRKDENTLVFKAYIESKKNLNVNKNINIRPCFIHKCQQIYRFYKTLLLTTHFHMSKTWPLSGFLWNCDCQTRLTSFCMYILFCKYVLFSILINR